MSYSSFVVLFLAVHACFAGYDACSGCFDTCSSADSCGYYTVKNGGGFYAQACLSGSDISSGEHFCCGSNGKYSEGKSYTFHVPCNSQNLILIGEEECASNSWSVGGAVLQQNATKNSSNHECWEISGSTLNNHWGQYICDSQEPLPNKEKPDRIVENLEKFRNQKKIQNDTDPNCYESCLSYDASGYVITKNSGGFNVRIQLEGKDSDKNKFCCTSGNFAEGQQQIMILPSNSVDLELTIQEEQLVGWDTVYTIQYPTPYQEMCYEIYGSTKEPKYEQIPCPGT